MAKEVSFIIKINDNGSAKRVTADAEELGRVIRSVQDESERLKSDILTWSQASQAIDVLQDSISDLQSVMADLTAAYQVQLVAETQLETIMRQRMNSTNEDIQSIKEFCSAQQEMGVIGDEVQLSGAQQMATFLKEKQSLDTLIPAMNNLIAQQNGLNATNQDAVSIGNMMGKAMQGLVASVAVTPFANGGIVYGPTLALMGEYAGAKSNPEVIAPLNKLKSLIGNNGSGGGGIYELKVKGRDLVAVLANETRINRKGTNIKI